MDLTIWQRSEIIAHSNLLLSSFERTVGRQILKRSGDPLADAKALFELPAVILSHGVEADPVLNYGNAIALHLWEMDFQRFTQMPSRLTAQPMLREERQRLLEQAAHKGYIDDYSGVRISSSGKLFRIENVILWNVTREDGTACGQAAYFDHWKDA